MVDRVDLQRYEITGRLGQGADYDVRSAVDRETGREVAIKRPVPQAVSRKQHGAIEERTARVLTAFDRAGNANGLLSDIVGYVDSAVHDSYFGDDLGEPYTVLVQERSPGIPLLGDMMSRFTGVPIAAGQNLFAVFPLVQAEGVTPFPVLSQLLELESHYLEAGYIIMDLRPQNVFYQPGTGRLQVIDTGSLAGVDDPAPRGRPPIDANDACLELLKFYTTFDLPPQDTGGYRDAKGVRPIPNVEQEIAELRRGLNGAGANVEVSGSVVLDKLSARAYGDFEQFRPDLMALLDAIDDRNRQQGDFENAVTVWQEALQWLQADYWTKFKFDAEKELAPYGRRGPSG